MSTHPRAIAEKTPDKPALIMADVGQQITYGELVHRADQAASLFAALGVKAGDTIAIMIENHVRYPELIWGAKNSGIRYVAVSTHLNGSDAAYVIADCGARLFITSARMAGLAASILDGLADKPALLMIDGAQPPFQSYEDLLSAQPAIAPVGRQRGPSMLYSSGTTGRPKGVRTAFPDAPPEQPPPRVAMLVGQYALGADTVFINPGPFYHSAPQRIMVTIMRLGGTTVGFRQFDPAATVEAIGRYGATHGFFVPTMFTRMLELDEQTRARLDARTLRHAIHAAAPCSMRIKRAMIDWWGPVISELYGGTESFGHTFITSPEWLAHPGSVGRPAPGCELRIVDESGAILPAGQTGRIKMKNGMQVAYHGDEAKTAALYDEDGFASLGDVGYVDDDGYLYLTDRESHMIIAGGVNIYPQEAENVLAGHPDIADVAVIGVPDDDMGEAVKAVVQLRAPASDEAAKAAEIIDWCRARLSLHKCPRSVDFVGELPRNEAGKLVKRIIKERYWSGTGRLI